MIDVETRKKVWAKGFELAQAAYWWADRETRAAVKSYREAGAPPIGSKDVKPGIPGLVEAIQPIADYWRRGAEIENRLRQRLLGFLVRQQLYGLGYPTPRKPQDPPELLPVDLWQPHYVSWGKSSVSGNGLEFVAVRIVHPDWLAPTIDSVAVEVDAKPSAPAAIAPPIRMGRPSKRAFIATVCRELLADGSIDPTRPMKGYLQQIRATVRARYPEDCPTDKGLGDDVIAEVLSAEISKPREPEKSADKR